MPNEFVARNGVIALNTSQITGSLLVTGGNIGIGTASPSQKLHIYGTGDQALFVENVGTYHIYAGLSSNVGYIGSSNATPLSLRTNGSSRLYIDTGGNVGIGTTSPLVVSNYTGLSIEGTNGSFYNLSSGGNTTGRFELNGTSNVTVKSITAIPLILGANNTEAMRITSAGNVGIGTTSPQSKLEIGGIGSAGTTDYGALTLSSGSSGLTLGWDSTNNRSYIYSRTFGVASRPLEINNTMYVIGGSSVGIGSSSPTALLNVSSSTAASVLRVDTAGGAGTLFVSGSGNVGIGTTSPGGLLQVGVPATATGALRAYSSLVSIDAGYQSAGVFGTAAAPSLIFGGDDNTGIWHPASDVLAVSTAGSERMRILSGGQLIVGGTTVGYSGTDLQVGNTSDTQNGLNILTSGSGYGYILFGDGSGADTYVGQISYKHGDDYMMFQTSGSERMRITSGGSLLIGATSQAYNPQTQGYLLGVKSNTTQAFISVAKSGQTLDSGGIIFGLDTTTGYVYVRENIDFAIGTNNTERIRILAGGNVGIGTTSPTLAKLQVNGNVWATSFTGSFSGSVTAPGSNTQVIYNSSGVLAGSSNFVFTGTSLGLGATPSAWGSNMRAIQLGSGGSLFQWTGSNGQISLGSNLYDDGASNQRYIGSFAAGQYVINNNSHAWYIAPSGTAGNAISWTQAMTLDASGRLGIGTTSPASLLHLNGADANSALFIQKAGSNILTVGAESTWLGTGTSNNAVLAAYGTNALLLGTNAAERMRITSGGSVQIGTSSASGAKTLIYDNRSNSNSVDEAALYVRQDGTNAIQTWAGNGGTERMRVTNGGNVGIGTSSPAARLDVNGNAIISGSFTVVTGSSIEFQVLQTSVKLGNASTDTITITGSLYQSGSTVAASLRGSGSAVFSVDGTSGRLFQVDDSLTGSLFSVNTAGGLPVIEAFSDNTVRIGQFGQRALYVSQSVVGVGLENPTAKLHVSASTGVAFEVDGASAVTALYVSSSGNVGIGTTNPISRLTVKSSNISTYAFVVTNQSNNRIAGIYETSGNAGQIYLSDSSTEKVKLSSIDASYFNGGSVGIGTTAPARLLDINGTTNFRDAYYFSNGVVGYTTWGTVDGAAALNLQAASGYALNFGTNGTTGRVVITSGGSVGIGTTAPTNKFEITHTIASNAPDAIAQFGSAGSGNWANSSHQVIIGGPSLLGYTGLIIYSDTTTGSGQISFADGRGANDSWRGSVTYDHSADAMILSTNATEKVRITSGGNVGIGSTSPTQKLDVVGYARATSGFVGNSGLSLWGDNSSGAAGLFVTTGGNVGIGTTSPADKFSVSSGSGASMSITTGQAPGSNASPLDMTLNFRGYVDGIKGQIKSRDVSSNLVDGVLIFSTANTSNVLTENMRIVATGNVGIGTSSPTLAKLQVNGNVWATSFTGSFSGSIAAPGSNTNVIYNSSGVFAGSNSFVFNGSSVGIGTTSPAYPLEVVAGSGNQFRLKTNDGTAANNSGIIFYNNASATAASRRSYIVLDPNGGDGVGGDYFYFEAYGDGTSRVINQNSGPLYLATSGVDRVTIAANGSVGIGTTSPGSSLHVAGDIASAPSGSGIHLGYASNFYGVIQSNGVSGSVIDFSSTGVDFRGRLLYDNSNNYLDISTNNAFAMRINSSGNVGIGTTTPNEKLHVAGNIHAYAASGIDAGLFASTAAGSTTIAIRSNGITHFNGGNVGIGTTAPAARLSITPASSYVTLRVNNSSGGADGEIFQRWAYLDTGDTYYLDLKQTVTSGVVRYNFSMVNNSTAYNDVLVLDRGNVGIGTTTPAAKLQVASGSGVTMLIGRANGLSSIKAGADASGGYLALDSSGGATIINHYVADNIWLATGGGNVGVGTTNPIAKLNVFYSNNTITKDNAAIRIDNDSGQSMIYFVNSGNQRGSIRVDSTGNMILNSYASNFYFNNDFGTGTDISFINTSTTFMVAKNGGNVLFNGGSVGIGTTSPSYTLDVNGIGRLASGILKNNSSTPTYLVFDATNRVSGRNYEIGSGYSGVGNDRFYIYDNTAGASRLVVDATGNVGINTTSPVYTLDVNGTARVTSLIETSTRTLKDNIQPYSTDISAFKQLEPVSFTWNNTGKQDVGLIAEDVEQIFPEFVSKTDEGEITGINYGKLSTIFINVLKQQQQKIELLEEQIKKLTS